VGVSLRTIQRWEKKNFKPSRLAQQQIKKVLELLSHF
jgi:DNA-binding transcriptional regulator YiaG